MIQKIINYGEAVYEVNVASVGQHMSVIVINEKKGLFTNTFKLGPITESPLEVMAKIESLSDDTDDLKLAIELQDRFKRSIYGYMAQQREML